MELNLRSFLRLIGHFASLCRKRWDRLARRLWYIITNFRLCFSFQHPKKTDDVGRNQSRPEKPSTTAVICASRLPPPLTPITGGNSPVIASPAPTSIQIRPPTILNREENLEEFGENNTDHLEADSWGKDLISRLPDFTPYQDGLDSIRVDIPLNRGDSASSSPVTPTRLDSRPSSRFSYRPTSQSSGFRPGYWPRPQRSRRPSSEHSYRSPLNGAESAARGYLSERPSPWPSSPAVSTRAPSPAGSVASRAHGSRPTTRVHRTFRPITRVYRVSRPTTRVYRASKSTARAYRASKPITRARRSSPMTNAPRPGGRPPIPASVRRSVHETHPDVPAPELPQPELRTTGSVHHDRSGAAASFGPLPAPPPKGILRPVIGIDRYGKHKRVVIEKVVRNYVCPPVTIQFFR